MTDKLTELEEHILVSIKSRDKIGLAELRRIFNQTNERTIRKAIENIRAKGYPVCSDNGYYYPTDTVQVQECIDGLMKRAFGVLQTANYLQEGKVNI